MRGVQYYNEIVGEKIIHTIYQKGKLLYNKHIIHINSTYQGGGVAEILASLVPMMNDSGFDAGWRILHGNPDFFSITKKFHNALQGDKINLSEIKKRLYYQASYDFSIFTHIDHDCVIVHDPQPLPLINYYSKRQPWIWRCHIDCSHPNRELWRMLRTLTLKYDLVIISNEDYRHKNFPVEQRIVYPAIDPLTSKNMDLKESDKIKYLKKFEIPLDKPLLTQISRFDKWKDPEGVVDVFEKVKEKVDCRLVLCGSMAADDPEGAMILERVIRKANRFLKNNDVILITSENNMLVNALQRASSVVIQKSIREGFGLTVTEALWKGTPVVSTKVGGIPLQVIDGENGYLLDPTDNQGFADRIIELMQNPSLAEEMGKKGKEHVREHFLITRLLLDYLNILTYVML